MSELIEGLFQKLIEMKVFSYDSGLSGFQDLNKGHVGLGVKFVKSCLRTSIEVGMDSGFGVQGAPWPL